MLWSPHPGPQTAFHQSRAFEVLYGGAAGGGKSEALLVEALRYVHVPGYRAILFRRTYPELEGQGSGMIPRSRELLEGVAEYEAARRIWHFRSGATLAFGHLEYEHSVHKYRSAQFAYLGFDELTTFSPSQYLYLFSRCRSVAGVPGRVRAATNPGGPGHLWVRRRFIDLCKPFEVRRFKREGGVEVACGADDPAGLTRQFIPATLRDNPTLMQRDPGYVQRLQALDPVDRARLLDGDWYIANAGLVFSNFTADNITEDEPDPARPLELAYDDGYIDPRALLVIQRTGTRILVADELYHTQHLGEQCIAELLARLAARGLPRPVLAVGSPEAIELRQHFRRADIPARGTATPLLESVKALRSVICDASGYRALRVHRRCTHLLQEVREGYQYRPGAEDETPLDRDNHACDALRYWVWVRR